MMMKRFIQLLVVILVVQGCKPKSLEIGDIQQAEEKLSISTFVVPGDKLMIGITKSFSALDDAGAMTPADLLADKLVNEAEVKLYVRDKQYELQLHSTGVYLLEDFDRHANEHYTLVVKDKLSGLAVSAMTQLKEKVEFNELSLGSRAIGKDSVPEITYSFYDKKGEENYYMINVDIILEHSEFSSEFEIRKPFTYLINDKGRDGELIGGVFAVISDQEYKKGDNVVITIANISKSYYDYQLAKRDRDMSVEFISEPFNLTSNIQGGYGYFNLIKADTYIKIYNN